MPRRKKNYVNPDKFDGPLKDRIFGLRIDDDVEVLVMAGDIPKRISGRLMRHSSTSLEILDEDGAYQWISKDWVVSIKLIKHNRPHHTLDPEYKKKKEPDKPKEPEPKWNEDETLYR